MTVVLSTKTLVLPTSMQKRYQTQDIVKLVLIRTDYCRFGGLPEKHEKSYSGRLESNPLMPIVQSHSTNKDEEGNRNR